MLTEKTAKRRELRGFAAALVLLFVAALLPQPVAAASGFDGAEQFAPGGELNKPSGPEGKGTTQRQDDFDEPSEDGTEVEPKVPAPEEPQGCPYRNNPPLELMV